MPFNGQGRFGRLRSWINDAANGIFMLPDLMDADANDIAAALSNCMTLDGQSSPSNNIGMNGKRLTNLGAAVDAGDALTKAAITQALITGALGFTPVQQGKGVGQDGGTAAVAIGSNGAATAPKPKLTLGTQDYGTLWTDKGATLVGSASAWAMKWPNGFTLQGGYITVTGDQPITFPLVFTALYGVWTRFLGRPQGSSLAVYDVNVGTANTSGFAGGPRQDTGGSVASAAGNWYWIAAGFITP